MPMISPNHERPITKLVAFVDTEPGQGILAMQTKFGVMPLITGDPDLVGMMRTTAIQIAKESGHRIEMREYSTYEVLEVM